MWLPSMHEIVAIHDLIARDFRTENGVLVPQLLEAAVDRARFGPFHLEATIHVRVAFIVRGIAQDHPFVDGNKRTAAVAMATIYRENGYRLKASNRELENFMIEVAKGDVALPGIVVWLSENTKKV